MKQPAECETMADIRAEIDRLDAELVALFAQRVGYIDRAAAIKAQGGETEERVGSLGPELIAKIPLLDEAGIKTGHRLARFIGVDGPKWFLRGVIGGAALNDAKAAADIDDLFRSVVVVRDDVPLPPKDLLTLTIPGGTVAPPRSI